MAMAGDSDSVPGVRPHSDMGQRGFSSAYMDSSEWRRLSDFDGCSGVMFIANQGKKISGIVSSPV